MRNADDWWNDSPIRRFKIPIELQSLEFMLLEPVNGIFCIIGPVFSHVTYVYLWNPLTNEFKLFPRPIVQMGYVAVGFGFGFVPNNNDYKVVRVIQHERKCDLRVEIYSLNRNSWRRVRDPCSIIGNARSGFCTGDVTVDLENEVITEGEPKYIHLTNREEDHRRTHCRTIAWSNYRDAISLTVHEDDLILCGRSRDDSHCSYRKLDFAGSLVSLNR